MDKSVDKYNNVIIRFHNPPNVQQLLQARIETENAILFVNVESNIIKEYNDITKSSKASFQFCHNNENIYLVRNKSGCPELVEGKLRAAGASIVVMHKDDMYAVYHKDRGRPVVTCIGGTSTQMEASLLDVAIREVLEETVGRVMINNVIFETYGLKLNNNNDLAPLLIANFKTKWFDFVVDDEYHCFPFVANSDDDDFFDILFHPDNCDDGIFMLKYIDHSETDFICAIKLDSDFQFSGTLDEILQLKQRVVPLPNNQRLSIIAQIANYANLKRSCCKCVLDIVGGNGEVFPPTLVSLVILPIA